MRRLNQRQSTEVIGGSEPVGITQRVNPGASCVIVAFGGINSGFGLPPYEFERILESMGQSTILIRDLEQSWYNAGIPGMGDHISSVGRSLSKMLDPHRRKRIVFIGNSAGGFAALILGWICDCDHTIAISPQTFLDRGRRLVHVDTRWRRQLRDARRRAGSPSIWDVRAAAPHQQSGTVAPQVDVYYSAGHRLDRLHAERLKDVEGVTLHARAHAGHGLAGALRSSGELLRILEASTSEA